MKGNAVDAVSGIHTYIYNNYLSLYSNVRHESIKGCDCAIKDREAKRTINEKRRKSKKKKSEFKFQFGV